MELVKQFNVFIQRQLNRDVMDSEWTCCNTVPTGGVELHLKYLATDGPVSQAKVM